MTIKDLLNLVEIRTKVASIFPFLFGTLYAIYHYDRIDSVNVILMFISLLFFDMTTTTVNNYIDYVKSEDREYRKRENVIGSEGFSLRSVKLVLLLMTLTALVCGILLALRTGPTILFLGGLSFAVGILYTAGPVPISRLPLGEIFSGGFMGFLIPFISVHIHRLSLLSIRLTGGNLVFSLALGETASLFLASVPLILSISNIMLANNICDLEQDIRNRRYPLPHFIGLPASLRLFRVSYICAYLAVPAGILSGALPLFSLATLLSAPLVFRNCEKFVKMPSKEKTFPLSAKNMMIIGLFHTLPLGVVIIFTLLFRP